MGIVPRKHPGAPPPDELTVLLAAVDQGDRDRAWSALIAQYTRLLLSIARSLGGDHDAAMERYSHILEKLRESDFRRLRAYRADAGATFSTWLTVTARNLCYDLHRHRFGRDLDQHSTDRTTSLRAVRRALDDLTEGDTPADSIEDASLPLPDVTTIHSERDTFLAHALSRLTSTDRLLLTLRFEDDKSAANIAQIVGFRTPFHVYRRLNAILEKLRTDLKARGIDDANG